MTGSRYLGIVLLATAGALDPGATALGQATKVPGLVQEGNYDSGNLGMQMQPAPPNADAGAVYAVGPWPPYTPPLADGEGTGLVQSFPRICRSTANITMQPPLPGATWEGEVNNMTGTFPAASAEP